MKKKSLLILSLTASMCLLSSCQFIDYLHSMIVRDSSSDTTIANNSEEESSNSDNLTTSNDEITSDEISSSEESISSSSKDIRELFVESEPKTSYLKYETLDLSELIVCRQTNTRTVRTKNYTLTWTHNNQVAKDKDILKFDAGNYQLEISETGYDSCFLDIEIRNISDFHQDIEITSLPQSEYYPKDVFSSSGMVVMLNTHFVDDEDTPHNKSETITDYTAKIEGASAKNYRFASAGTYTLTISYTGYDDTLLTCSHTLIVNESTYTPIEYEDDSIEFVTDDDTVTINITNSTKSNSDKGYYSPDEVTVPKTIYDYGFQNAYNWHYTPTTGKVPILFVPVVIPGYENKATDANWQLIKKCAFGKRSDMHFESLHSYYYQASYGQLDFTGIVTDYFYPSQYSTEFKSVSDFTESNNATLAQLALDWAVDTLGVNAKEYDSDNDGFVDAMWMVYMKNSESGSEVWWPFSYKGNENANINDPNVNNYGWCGLDFLDDSYSSQTGLTNKDGDAHVMIHETGHMLGLTDYYSYSYSGYSPLGGFDMMDQNLGDHNPYSKMLYGWIKPYIAYGNCSITLNTCQLKDNVIVIPYDNKTYTKDSAGKVKFNVFDEYLIVDFYTDQNLYRQGYDLYGANKISGRGGRIYHVDSRLGYYYGGFNMFTNPDDVFTSTRNFIRLITNSESGNRAESTYISSLNDAFDEIRLISADKRFLSDSNKANINSMFSSTTNTFSLSSYSSQFPLTTKFNNGQSCSYNVTFNF